MYRRLSEGWFKHIDFMLMDLLSLQIAFALSCGLWGGLSNLYGNPLYREMAVVLALLSVCVAFFTENHKNILHRGYLKEFKATVIQAVYVAACESIYLFLTKQSEEFSRISFLCFVVLYPALMYGMRCLLKRFLRNHGNVLGEKKGILLVASADVAEDLAVHMEKRCLGPMKILGIGLIENNISQMKIGSYPIVASGEKEILDYAQNNWVDEVVVRTSRDTDAVRRLIERFSEMGIVVHQCLNALEGVMANQSVAKLWGYTVLTSYINVVTYRQVLLKRSIDICGAIIGLIITGILTIVIGPVIYAVSPGPIFFSQVRIGRGGKRFKIYKFRSMYMDAEKRKAELMEKNKMSGYMFKLDADPRILGSGDDGTRKGIGWFIRKTSIDEFPQFWNVLKGDMSLVGTRPPTVDEWEKYEYHHRARMATKPGITGLWQVSGRSDITDFEEVVALDMEYIRNWTLGEDIKILFRTVGAVVKGRGSV